MQVNYDVLSDEELSVVTQLNELAAKIESDTPFMDCVSLFFETYHQIETLLQNAISRHVHNSH